MRALLAVSIWLFVLHASQAEPTPASKLTVGEFTRYDEFSDAKISPDGEHYAFVTHRYGADALVFIRIRDKKIAGAIRISPGYVVDGYSWVSKSRVIYSIAYQRLAAPWPGRTGAIFAGDIDGGQQAMIYGTSAQAVSRFETVAVRLHARSGFLSTLRSDRDHILIAEQAIQEKGDKYSWFPGTKPTLLLIDVHTGEQKAVERSPLRSAGFLLDRADRVRVVTGLDDRSELTLSFKAQPEGAWSDLPLAGFRDQSVWLRSFAADESSVLLTGARENDVGSALYRVALPSGEIKRVLGIDGAGIGDVVDDLFRPEVAGVVGNGDDPPRRWLEPDGQTARLYEGLYKAFPHQRVEVTSVTDGARRAIVRVASDTNAGDFYFFNIDTKTIDPLQAARPWSDPAKMQPVEAVTFKARDGLQLHGYVTRPSGNGPHPLVLIVNPSPMSYFAWEFDWQAQLFASRGYAVLEVNPRGSRSDRTLERAGAGEWGRAIQDDLADATRWAIDRSIAQSGHVCIFGSQYGGYAALTGAVRDPKLYTCAIGQFGVYDLESIPEELTFSLGGTDYLKTMLGADRKEWHARSPTANAEKIEAAVLLIHTDSDDAPNFKQAKRMKAALDDAHKPYESLELKGKDLNALEEGTRRTTYERIVDFLDRKIGTF